MKRMAVMSVRNLVSCINVFSDHIRRRFGVDVTILINAQELRELFFDEMKGIRDSIVTSGGGGTPLKSRPPRSAQSRQGGAGAAGDWCQGRVAAGGRTRVLVWSPARMGIDGEEI